MTDEQWITLDGYDPNTGELETPLIAVWKDLQNKGGTGAVTNLPHGTKAKLICREGDGLLIETKDGKRGWITAHFTREFKGDVSDDWKI